MLDSAGFRMAQVLVVCTGNICRSPMAEGFLKELFRLRANDSHDTEPPVTGVEAIDVSSAGTSGWDGSPATPEAIEAAADREADITDHRARRLHAGHVEDADLVIGMTTEHRDTAIQLVPTAAARTFTLKELVQLMEALPAPRAASTDGEAAAGETGPATGEATSADDATRLRQRIEQADALRLEGFVGNRFDLDVVDPIGLSIDTYRAVAWELDQLCTRLVDGLFGKSAVPPSLASMWNEGE